MIRTHFINTSVMRSVRNRMMARRVPQRIVVYSQGRSWGFRRHAACQRSDTGLQASMRPARVQRCQRRFWTEPGGNGRFGRIALLRRSQREPLFASRPLQGAHWLARQCRCAGGQQAARIPRYTAWRCIPNRPFAHAAIDEMSSRKFGLILQFKLPLIERRGAFIFVIGFRRYFPAKQPQGELHE
jgi:hypothetical protein